MMSLNNREIAWLVWLGIFFGWILTQKQVREALWHVVKAFCAPVILRVVASMLLYVGVCVLLLASLHIWQWDNLKTTILWSMTFALVTMLDVNRVSENDTFYGQTVRDTVSATALLLFVSELESFSLIAELIFVPSMVCLGLLLAVAQTQPEAKSAKSLVEGVASLVGFGLLLSGAIAIWNRPDEFLTISTLREFAVPTMLSVMFLPLMYILSVYMVAERLFVRLAFVLPDKSLRSYAKAKALFAFAGNLESLRRWGRNIGRAQPVTRADIDRSICEVLEARWREGAPPVVPTELGWSPYRAAMFLNSEGLRTNDYHRSYDGLWLASSPLKELDDELFSNNVSYYVEGDDTVATRLKLALNINNTSKEGDARDAFSRMAQVLVGAALSDFATEKLAKATKAGRVCVLRAVNANIRLTRDEWKNGKLKGYKLLLSIVHDKDASAIADTALSV